MSDITINQNSYCRIISNTPNTNFTDRYSAGNQSGVPQTQRGLIKLDFTGISAGSTINSVSLNIWNEVSYCTNDRTLRAFRSIRAWTTACTWNTYDGSNAWGTVGSANTTLDREATDCGAVVVPYNIATGAYFSLGLTTALIQDMFSGAFTNNGIILQFDVENDDLHDFLNTPQLVINYTAATTTSTSSTTSTSTSTTSTSTSTTSTSSSTSTTSTSSSTSTSRTTSTSTSTTSTITTTSTTSTTTSTSQTTTSTSTTSTSSSTSTSTSTSTTTSMTLPWRFSIKNFQ